MPPARPRPPDAPPASSPTRPPAPPPIVVLGRLRRTAELGLQPGKAVRQQRPVPASLHREAHRPVQCRHLTRPQPPSLSFPQTNAGNPLAGGHFVIDGDRVAVSALVPPRVAGQVRRALE